MFDASNWETEKLDFRQRHRKTLVIIAELKRAPLSSPRIQIPEDRRIVVICRKLEADPSIGKSIEAWAGEVGASAKTIQRALVASTAQTFRQWRDHVRMTRALELHARGSRLLDIVIAVGYATEGAYAQAFKKFCGHPPSRLRSRKLWQVRRTGVCNGLPVTNLACPGRIVFLFVFRSRQGEDQSHQ
jgi:AraC-like DNA-binding protein